MGIIRLGLIYNKNAKNCWVLPGGLPWGKSAEPLKRWHNGERTLEFRFIDQQKMKKEGGPLAKEGRTREVDVRMQLQV